MGYRDPTYVVFDGDNDMWAYGFMKGWKVNERIDFDFYDAHDLDTMTSRAQNEDYVKRQLRERMRQSSAVLVIVGDNTRWLYEYIRWEIDYALELELPIVVANLNEKKSIDHNLCPPILRNECVLHVPFKMKAIKMALDIWPTTLLSLSETDKARGGRELSAAIYKELGL